jgi:Short-chain dehydrogenases of various substrate specificities
MLKGKVSIVTAASRGIGAGVASVLAREGSDLVIASRDSARLEKLARELEAKYGVSVVPVQADLTKREDVRRDSGGRYPPLRQSGCVGLQYRSA